LVNIYIDIITKKSNLSEIGEAAIIYELYEKHLS